MAPMRHRFLGALAASSAISCGGAVPSSHLEDVARRDLPIAICRTTVPKEAWNEAGGRRSDALWSRLVPGFRGLGSTLEAPVVDCTGEALDADDLEPKVPAEPVYVEVGPGLRRRSCRQRVPV
jgi:hypothetical protein